MTKLCRGLITNGDGNIIARSFQKFFNYGEESDDHVPTASFVVQDKMDGSLIMLFWYADAWHTASRGSFVSTQANKAKDMIDDKYCTDNLDKNLTYVFEIIYPQNRIVVDYGSKESLTFLACFDKSGVEYIDQNDTLKQGGFEIVKQHSFYDYTSIQKLNWKGAEGFVVRFSNGHRVKMKFQNYVDLHRVVTNPTPKKVWSMFRERLTLEQCVEHIPDEFHLWFREQWTNCETRYSDLKSKVLEVFETFQTENYCRRDLANAIKDHQYKKFIFMLADNKKDIHDLLCATIEAEAEEQCQRLS